MVLISRKENPRRAGIAVTGHVSRPEFMAKRLLPGEGSPPPVATPSSRTDWSLGTRWRFSRSWSNPRLFEPFRSLHCD
jgi:hypothetical protein